MVNSSAGTYANGQVAVSATGAGEFFIRAVFAHQVATRHAAGQLLPLALAASLADLDSLSGDPAYAGHDGHGGAIVMPARGRPLLGHSTAAMASAWHGADGSRGVYPRDRAVPAWRP